MLFYRRLLHALDNHGLRGLIYRVVTRLDRRPDLSPGASPTSEARHPFDVIHHVDTSGYIPGEQLQTGAASDLYNTAYYGISPSTLSAALALLPAPHANFTFIDLGCGKGRALLIAAAFEFPTILGAEIVPTLCEIARANTSANPRIRIEQADAATLTYPPAALVVYLYHPFLGPQLKRVLKNLEVQLKICPREAFLLIANPSYPRILARFSFLREVWDYRFPLSPEDAAADRHRIIDERYTLYRASLP